MFSDTSNDKVLKVLEDIHSVTAGLAESAFPARAVRSYSQSRLKEMFAFTLLHQLTVACRISSAFTINLTPPGTGLVTADNLIFCLTQYGMMDHTIR